MTTKQSNKSILLLLIILPLLPTLTRSQKFDPYKLNGGLIAAVAGRDYVLIASDTRLTDGGYGVHSRRYLSGRLWSASSSSSSSSSSTMNASPVVVVETVDGDNNNSLVSSASNLLQSTSTLATRRHHDVHWDSDGSLLLPSSSITTNTPSSSTLTTQNHPITTAITTNPPILIGSAGCASDCESLKRRMRLELDALTIQTTINGNNNNLGVASVANLLQQILYSRRGFPFYSFCVVAGLHPRDGSSTTSSGREEDSEVMEGAVYVYDAIGSYERVAVGSAGTGRELLQPILDQLFSDYGSDCALSGVNNGDDHSKAIYKDENHSNSGKSGDIMAIPPMKQRVGVAGSLRPPVQTTVRCTLEDAVKNVARAYQSVAEREISVGDEVVICVVKSSVVDTSPSSAAGYGGSRTEGAVLKVYRYPLKKH